MRLLLCSLVCCLVKRGSVLVGLHLQSDEVVSQAVDENRQCVSQTQGFRIVDRKVETFSMDGFVTSKPANITKLLQSRRKTKAFDLLLKVSSLGSQLLHKSLKANAQKRTSGSRRCVCDLLSFIKNPLDVFRHALNWRNSASHWVHELFVGPKMKFAAMRTTRNEVIPARVQVKEVGRFEVNQVVKHERIIPIEVLIPFVALQDRHFMNLTHNTAMRATK